MATGEMRATMALTEPGGGSDLQAMRTVARRDGDEYVVNGSKTWISNARRSGSLVALLCRPTPTPIPAHRGISILLVEKGPGFKSPATCRSSATRVWRACELGFDDFRTPATALLGWRRARGSRR
jgi:alkylation response protein AidB-like acyl-CoA dehydrogenase